MNKKCHKVDDFRSYLQGCNSSHVWQHHKSCHTLNPIATPPLGSADIENLHCKSVHHYFGVCVLVSVGFV